MTTPASFLCQELPLGPGLYLNVEIFAADSWKPLGAMIIQTQNEKVPLGGWAALAIVKEV